MLLLQDCDQVLRALHSHRLESETILEEQVSICRSGHIFDTDNTKQTTIMQLLHSPCRPKPGIDVEFQPFRKNAS